MGPPGHIAIAFLIKPATPKASLWVLILATEILDLLCFGFMAAGIEHASPEPYFPWSHGLFMSAVWATIAIGIALYFKKDRQTSAFIGLATLSHWVLDFISHDSDLPLFFDNSLKVGLGLESSLAAGLLMELSLLAAGVAIYLVSRKKRTRSTGSTRMPADGDPR
jgi:hypothetical protein